MFLLGLYGEGVHVFSAFFATFSLWLPPLIFVALSQYLIARNLILRTSYFQSIVLKFLYFTILPTLVRHAATASSPFFWILQRCHHAALVGGDQSARSFEAASAYEYHRHETHD